jgi:hypothetical protein
VAEIKEINGLESNNLKVSQILQIPIGTATPTPTLTPSPTLTPTPGPPWPAPILLAPTDGATTRGGDQPVLLTWSSVGILQADEWYVVRLRQQVPAAVQLPWAWTKATSWLVPAEYYAEDPTGPQRFRWEVVIMRRTGTAEDGTWEGENISPSSKARTFFWD